MNDPKAAEALFDLALGQSSEIDAAKWNRRISEEPATAAIHERCKRLLQPLAADADQAVVPVGLRIRTLAAVAEVLAERNIARRQASVAPAKPTRSPWILRVLSGRDTPLRLDVVVVASIALIVVGLGLGALGKLRREHQAVACREELRALHLALIGYADTHHGRLPEVGSGGLTRPALLAEVLVRNGQYDPAHKPICPAWEFDSAGMLPVTYSYTLGYRDGETGPVQGIQLRSSGIGELTPIAADLPPHRDADRLNFAHGHGQNVLLLGGSVRFLTGTTSGPNDDDIFRNDHGVVRAGLNARDVSLGGPNDLP